MTVAILLLSYVVAVDQALMEKYAGHEIEMMKKIQAKCVAVQCQLGRSSTANSEQLNKMRRSRMCLQV